MDRLMSAVAVLVLIGFLGILGWKVGEPDLMVVLGFTTLLVLWDVISAAWRR